MLVNCRIVCRAQYSTVYDIHLSIYSEDSYRFGVLYMCTNNSSCVCVCVWCTVHIKSNIIINVCMENPSACGERGMEVQSKHYTYSIHTDAGHTHAHRTLPEPEHEACAAVLYVYRRRRVSVSVVHTRVKREACTDPILPVCICLPPVCVCVVWENKRVLNVQTQMRGTQKKNQRKKDIQRGKGNNPRRARRALCVRAFQWASQTRIPNSTIITPPALVHAYHRRRRRRAARAVLLADSKNYIIYTAHTKFNLYFVYIFSLFYVHTETEKNTHIEPIHAGILYNIFMYDFCVCGTRRRRWTTTTTTTGICVRERTDFSELCFRSGVRADSLLRHF